MTDSRTCSSCGAKFPPGSSEGAVCPACMLERAMVDTDALDQEVDLESATLGPEGEGSGRKAPKSSPVSRRKRSSPAGRVGTVIGHYTLTEKLGEGGFGVVWKASQSEPVKREVALKLLKQGMASEEVLTRFEAERQALAMMDHPNIAKVHDAGTSESGTPYFVMEFVAGTPLTEYCDEHKLSLNDRLKLFGQVCAGVQHAHQKGIIHRDLKPANVLVVEHDGKPVPKVIDFGIAKAVGQDLTEKALETVAGQIIGTPVYMSPEQASGLGQAADIDTRSDVYSLGVILYELLSGRPPFEPKELMDAGYVEMERIIREVEPPNLSVRFGRISAADRSTIATDRDTLPDKLTRFVRGDLEWVVMKALSKERERRYETATAFAQDIEHYLHHEPVAAGPPSAIYRMRRYARKHRAPLAAAALVLITLVAGVAVSSWQAVEAHRARAEAEEARAESEEARVDAEGVSDFLIGMFESASPGGEGEGREVKVADVLDEAAARLEIELADQPERRAELQRTMANTYHALGLYSEAIPLMEKVLDYRQSELGRDHTDTLSATDNLAYVLFEQGRYAEAEPLFREALEGKERTLGREHPSTLNSIEKLAMLLQDQGQFEEAETLFREVLEAMDRLAMEQSRHHPGMLNTVNNLAIALQLQEKYDEAEPLFRDYLEGNEKALGRNHLSTLNAMNSLANLLRDQGGTHKLAEAEKLSREALEGRQEILGRDHPDTLISVANLGSILKKQGNLADAEKLAREAVEGKERTLGRDHPSTLISINMLAAVLEARGKHQDAEKLYREAHDSMGRKFGSEHPYTADSKKDLERILQVLENPGSQSDDAGEIKDLLASLAAKGETALHRAAYTESIDLVRMVIETGVDVNAQDAEGFTALHNAVEDGKFQHLPLLLKHGADPNVPNSTGETPLMTAARRIGDMATIQLLLGAGAELHVTTEEGITTLHNAAGGGHPEVVKMLLDAGVPVDTPTRDALNTPLMLAAYGASGQQRIHASLNPQDDSESRGDEAAYIKVVELLIAAGADVENQRDHLGGTPLHAAAHYGQLDIARLLLSNGARLDTRNEQGETPLHLAAGTGGSAKMVGLLIAEGGDVDAVTKEGRTPLHFAAGNGSAETVALLLELGADIDAVQKNHASKGTPLVGAVTNGKIENVELLLERGADLHATFFGKGATLLHLAVHGQHVEVAKLLIEAGIGVDARDVESNTPLILSAMWANLEMPQMLIDHGADVSAENNGSFTALMVARNRGNNAMARLLQGDRGNFAKPRQAKASRAGDRPKAVEGAKPQTKEVSAKAPPPVVDGGKVGKSDAEQSAPFQAFVRAGGERDYAEALVQAKALRDQFPDAAIAWRSMGVAQAALGEHDKAIESFRHSIELDPGDAVAHYSLGTSLDELGMREDAVDAYRRVIEIDPDLADRLDLQNAIDPKHEAKPPAPATPPAAAAAPTPTTRFAPATPPASAATPTPTTRFAPATPPAPTAAPIPELVPEPKIIREIEVKSVGLSGVAKEQVLSHMSTKVGDELSSAQLDDDIAALFATGMADNVKFFSEAMKGNNTRLIVQLTGRSLLGAVEVKGSTKFSTKQIFSLLSLSVGKPVDKAALQKGRAAIQKMYRDKGLPEVEVRYQIAAPDDQGQSTVSYVIAEEGPPILRKLEFVGNTAFTSRELREQMKLKATSLDGVAPAKIRLGKEVTEAGVRHIEDHYQDNGYLNVRVENVATLRVDKEQADLVITISEGEQYGVNTVEVNGLRGVSLDDIGPKLHQKAGAVYSGADLKHDLKLIGDAYGSRGYVDNRVVPKLTPAGPKQIDVSYHITEGEQFRLGRIIIEGNVTVKHEVILREVLNRPGEVFDTTQLEATRNRLMKLNLFEPVDILSTDSPMTGVKDLLIIVSEKPAVQ